MNDALMKSMDWVVQYNPFSPAQWEEHHAIMDACSTVIDSLTEKAKEIYGQRTSRERIRIELFRSLDGGPARAVKLGHPDLPDAPKRITVSRANVLMVMEVKQRESRILESVAKLVFRQARRYHRHYASNTGMEFEDMYSECLMAASRAIYAYHLPNRLTTLIVHTMRNHCVTISNKSQPFSRWPNQARVLLKQFKAAEREAMAKGPVSYDELVKQMKLEPEQRRELDLLLVKMSVDSDHGAPDDEFSILDVVTTNEIEDRDVLVREAIANVDLSTWERIVLNAFLNAPSGTKGWMTRVAEENINPDTGKPYSRRAPRVALDRIFNQLRERLIAA